MTASGSSEGTEYGRSRVATSLTQSVDPGSGTSSILRPASAYQPSLVAMAKGAAAELMVRAHQPTRIVVSAALDDGDRSVIPATHAAAASAPAHIPLITPLPCPARRTPLSATGPRRGPDCAP